MKSTIHPPHGRYGGETVVERQGRQTPLSDTGQQQQSNTAESANGKHK